MHVLSWCCITSVFLCVPFLLTLQLQAQEAILSGAEKGGFVLKGWYVYILVAVLLIVAGGVSYVAYQYFINPRRNYTLVVKKGPDASMGV